MLSICAALAIQASQSSPEYLVKELEGWTIHVRKELIRDQHILTNRALGLLQNQLKEIRKVVPAEAVAKLQTIQLWFSPDYPGISPRAEYHPGVQWLRENKRDPKMVHGVEFSNIRIFEKETRRMPNFALHELAHAYHDRFLPDGFKNAEVRKAYESAKSSGIYDRVIRRDADGKETFDKAYAMVTAMEYFAETSEAYFSRNDFFPFNRIELQQHDPGMTELLGKLWQTKKD